jgi:hypothetical protein
MNRLPALHTFEVFHSMDEGSRRIPDVDVAALVMSFEQDNETVISGPIDELIDQEIDAHPCEIGGKTLIDLSRSRIIFSASTLVGP